jgi:hypothetical protein
MSSTRRRLERLEARLPARPEAEDSGLLTPAARRFFDADDDEAAMEALVEWAEETNFTPEGLLEALMQLGELAAQEAEYERAQ